VFAGTGPRLYWDAVAAADVPAAERGAAQLGAELRGDAPRPKSDRIRLA
jgi:hypothetical protein